MKKSFVLFALSLLLLSSCSTERRSLNQMRSLTENIEKYGDRYEMEDWEKAYERYQAIDGKMDTSRLSQAQAKEYGELKGRAVAKFAKSQVEKVVDGIGKYVNQGIGILKGILDGVKEE